MSGALVPMRGRAVLVTGSNRGVGLGLVRAFAAAGALVVVTARDRPAAEAVAEELRARGGVAVAVPCDVTSAEQVEAAVAAGVEAFGRLDAVVHNAVSVRSSEPHDLLEGDESLWDDHASVSITALFRLARAAHPHLAASRGSLLVLTSPAGINGTATTPFYGVVKGAQRGFVTSLAREWGADGIRVNGLAPLAMTPALAASFRNNPGMQQRLTAVVPLGRFGDPEHDIGPAAVFLCSDGARYVTGQNLVVSGGRLTGAS